MGLIDWSGNAQFEYFTFWHNDVMSDCESIRESAETVVSTALITIST